MKQLADVSRTAVVVLALAGAVAAAPAWERQADMKSMAGSARIVGELFEGKRPYSQAEFKEAAENIQMHGGKRIVDDFQGPPEPDSKADLAMIASSADEFGKLAREPRGASSKPSGQMSRRFHSVRQRLRDRDLAMQG